MGKRTRSPNYPRLSLADAIERAGKLYQKESTHKTNKEAVAKGLGYTSLNGASLGLISTLKQYGLLEEEADGLRVSQDAVALVMLPEGDSERTAALQRAAFAPRLFSELREEYGDTLPSDVSLRFALIKKGYSEKAANEAIRSYRDTLELVSEETAGYDVADEEDQQQEPPMRQPTNGPRFPDAPPNDPFAVFNSSPTPTQQRAAPATVLQFQISGNSSARIELAGDVTQEALERLATILDAQKFVFPSEKQPEQPATDPTAEQHAAEMPPPE